MASQSASDCIARERVDPTVLSPHQQRVSQLEGSCRLLFTSCGLSLSAAFLHACSVVSTVRRQVFTFCQLCLCSARMQLCSSLCLSNTH